MILRKPLNQYFDHTLLRPDATSDQITQLCREAKDWNLYAVCVNGCYVKLCADALKGSPVKVAAVVGFPLGACTTAAKVFEAVDACKNGAQEIDMVINVGACKDGRYNDVEKDILNVVQAVEPYDAIVKVILETCLLLPEEIEQVCTIALKAGAHFVKTSTGFSIGGATEDDVALMYATVGHSLKVKASGGIRDYETAIAMIEAGADRIGASASVKIMEEYQKHE